MALQPNEILIRWNDLGQYSGAHTIRRDDATGKLDDAKPIGIDATFPWPEIVTGINADALAQVEVLKAQIASDAVAAQAAQTAAGQAGTDATAALAALQAFSDNIIAQAEAALGNPALSKDDVLAQIQALVSEAKKPALQRQKESIEAQIAELQQQASQLPA